MTGALKPTGMSAQTANSAQAADKSVWQGCRAEGLGGPLPDRGERPRRRNPTASSPASMCPRPRLYRGSGTLARRSSRYWLRAAGIGEDVIGGLGSLAAEDGERRNFHRSALAHHPPLRHGRPSLISRLAASLGENLEHLRDTAVRYSADPIWAAAAKQPRKRLERLQPCRCPQRAAGEESVRT